MKETDLVRAIIAELTARGCMVWRQNSGGMTDKRGQYVRFNGAPGCSDIIGMTPWGTFLAVECKVGRNKPTDKQAAFLADVNAHGGIGIVVRDNCDGMWDAIEAAEKFNQEAMQP